MLVERWRRICNADRPHSSLGYRTSALEALYPFSFTSTMPQRTNRTGQLATSPQLKSWFHS